LTKQSRLVVASQSLNNLASVNGRTQVTNCLSTTFTYLLSGKHFWCLYMPENWQPTGADRPNVTRTIQYYSLK